MTALARTDDCEPMAGSRCPLLDQARRSVAALPPAAPRSLADGEEPAGRLTAMAPRGVVPADTATNGAPLIEIEPDGDA